MMRALIGSLLLLLAVSISPAEQQFPTVLYQDLLREVSDAGFSVQQMEGRWYEYFSVTAPQINPNAARRDFHDWKRFGPLGHVEEAALNLATFIHLNPDEIEGFYSLAPRAQAHRRELRTVVAGGVPDGRAWLYVTSAAPWVRRYPLVPFTPGKPLRVVDTDDLGMVTLALSEDSSGNPQILWFDHRIAPELPAGSSIGAHCIPLDVVPWKDDLQVSRIWCNGERGVILGRSRASTVLTWAVDFFLDGDQRPHLNEFYTPTEHSGEFEGFDLRVESLSDGTPLIEEVSGRIRQLAFPQHVTAAFYRRTLGGYELVATPEWDGTILGQESRFAWGYVTDGTTVGSMLLEREPCCGLVRREVVQCSSLANPPGAIFDMSLNGSDELGHAYQMIGVGIDQEQQPAFIIAPSSFLLPWPLCGAISQRQAATIDGQQALTAMNGQLPANLSDSILLEQFAESSLRWIDIEGQRAFMMLGSGESRILRYPFSATLSSLNLWRLEPPGHNAATGWEGYE